MDECELITIVTAVACGISKCCPEDDIALMAAVFTQLGDTLNTVLVQRENRNGNNGNSMNPDIGKSKLLNNVSTDTKYNNCTVYYKDKDYNTEKDTPNNNSTYFTY